MYNVRFTYKRDTMTNCHHSYFLSYSSNRDEIIRKCRSLIPSSEEKQFLVSVKIRRDDGSHRFWKRIY